MSKLIELREKLNLTQEELAEKSGLSVRTIQRIEAGTEPKGYTRKTLAKTLEINEHELLEKKDSYDELNFTLLKLINLSALPVTFIPPANIILPLIIMFAKKQFNPLAKQLISVQILWTILSATIFIFSSFLREWFSLGSKFVLIVTILLVLTNVYIILKNAISLDRKRTLYFGPRFSIL